MRTLPVSALGTPGAAPSRVVFTGGGRSGPLPRPPQSSEKGVTAVRHDGVDGPEYAAQLAATASSAPTAPTAPGKTVSSPPGQTTAKVNLLLVTIDTTRADHLGCYGSRRAATPSLDAIARSGVLFDNAISPAPLTLPSHTTIMTGLVPRHHGVRDNAVFRLGSSIPTLASILSARGYATAAVVGAAVLDRSTGISRGFDRYDDRVRIGQRSEFNYEERAAANVTDAAVSTLSSITPPFFLWVHYYDPHFPYVPPAPYSDRFRSSPYDGEIAYVDAQIGRLLATPALAGGGHGTLLVVAGDHGESLGEHGEDRHDLFVYQATQHVPLLVRGPAIAQGRRIVDRVGLVDVCPTVLDLLRIESPAGLDGRSLAPLLSSRPAPAQASSSRVGSSPGAPVGGSGRSETRTTSSATGRPDTYEIESFFPAYSYGWAPSVALISDRWKYTGTPVPELYDLVSDPGEKRNLILAPDAASKAAPAGDGDEGRRAEVQRSPADSDRQPPGARAGGSTKSSSPPPRRSKRGTDASATASPRSRAESLAVASRLAAELRRRYRDDDAARAFSAPACLREIEDTCPSVGSSTASSGGPTTRSPATDTPTQPGRDTGSEQEDEQRERLEALGYVGGSVRPGERPPSGPLRDPKRGVEIVRTLDRARILLQKGDARAAARALEPVAAEDGRNFPVLATLGAACIEAGLYDRGIEVHRKTLALRPSDALPHSNLAGALRAKAASLDGASPGQAGRPGEPRAAALRDEAAHEYEAALKLSPRDSESYFGYAQLEIERSRSQAARSVLARAHTAGASDPEMYVLQGRVEAALGDEGGARTAFERAVALDPRSGDAHEGLGHLDYEAGKAQDAAAHYARALDVAPTAARAKTLGAIRLYALSDKEGARAAFRRALELSPAAADAREITEILRDLDSAP